MEKETTGATASPLDEMKGAFVGSLVRNNKKIREDRAIAIAEAAGMLYKRTVEDIELEMKRLKREREAMSNHVGSVRLMFNGAVKKELQINQHQPA